MLDADSSDLLINWLLTVRTLPDDVQELVLGDEPIAVLDEQPQDVERLRLERDDPARPPNLHATEIDGNVPEFIEFRGHHSFTRASIPRPGKNIISAGQFITLPSRLDAAVARTLAPTKEPTDVTP